MSATINLEKKHLPVLLDELIKIISPRYSGTFLDCTFGQGGYTEKILENTQNKVITLAVSYTHLTLPTIYSV